MDPIFALLTGLEQSAFGGFVRSATWLYPLANITHVLAILVFFALVATMDLAVIRRPWVDADDTIRAARWPAFAAFGVILASGAILLTPEATAVARNPAFQLKLIAIALGGLNLALFSAGRTSLPMPVLRASAGVSMALWLTTAACGRAIAYL